MTVLTVLLSQAARMYADTVDRAEELESEAHTDTLTGLPNRRRFDEEFRARVRLGDAASSPIAVAIIDIDRFKLQRSFGHQAGDEALQRIARRDRRIASNAAATSRRATAAKNSSSSSKTRRSAARRRRRTHSQRGARCGIRRAGRRNALDQRRRRGRAAGEQTKTSSPSRRGALRCEKRRPQSRRRAIAGEPSLPYQRETFDGASGYMPSTKTPTAQMATVTHGSAFVDVRRARAPRRRARTSRARS